MKFLIKSLEPTTSRLYSHVYDNINNKLQTFDGSPLVLKLKTKSESFFSQLNDNNDKSCFHTKIRQLRKLKIQLGFRCNFNCKYCNQRAYENAISINPEKHLDLTGFVEKIQANVESVSEILFMGGEPFVYIKTLDPLCKRLRSLYPDARFHTITNGSLIDVKVADWCIENRFNLTISHDGPQSSKYRDGIDILEDPKTLAGIRHYIDRNNGEKHGLEAQINVVVTADNWKLSELSDFFREKLQRDIRIQFESIAKLNETTVDQVDPFTNESVNGLIEEILMAGTDGRLDNPLGYFRRTANNLVQRIISETDLSRLKFYCDNSRRDTMAVDLQGNLLACHAYPSFRTGYATIDEMTTATCDIPRPWTSREDCQKCPLLVSCLGGCPLQGDVAHEITCRNLKIWHMGLFMVAWYQMLGTIIQTIEPMED